MNIEQNWTEKITRHWRDEQLLRLIIWFLFIEAKRMARLLCSYFLVFLFSTLYTNAIRWPDDGGYDINFYWKEIWLSVGDCITTEVRQYMLFIL